MSSASSAVNVWPKSIGIAGAWGYIGRRFLDAALRLGIVPSVLDPGQTPGDVPLDRVGRFSDEREFYRAPVDLYHLALHPDARQRALELLLERAGREPVAILNEKPMAPPDRPNLCKWLITATEAASYSALRDPHSALGSPLLLFDFHELYSPLTQRIVDWLLTQPELRIDSIEMTRSKDREDPANPRNYKLMVPIQYQETVHCLAWVLFVLGRLRGSLAEALGEGLTATAQSQPYAPPNPKDYPYVVDGQCVWELQIPTPHSALRTPHSFRACHITGRTDFKRSAPWTKRRVVRGTAGGRPFTIEAEFQEGCKQLVIDGVDQRVDAQSSSPEEVLQTFGRWRRDIPRDELMHGVYPNPRFAHATYQLSSALWRAGCGHNALTFDSLQALLDFDAGYAAAVAGFQRYA